MSDQRYIYTAVLVTTVILFVPNLFLRGLWSPDEPRYAAIAWRMQESGDFLLPHINEEVYRDKPPLFFILACLADQIAPPNGGRLVEALAMAALALLLSEFLPSEQRSARRSAPLIFLGCGASLMIGKFGVIDALFVLGMVAAIACGRRALASQRPVGAWLGCYAALAAACLVKGPAIIPFTILALLGSRGDLTIPAARSTHCLGNLLGVFLFAALIGGWLVPVCLRGGEEYCERLLGQVPGRVTGARATHISPWHYYLVAASFYFAPWSLILLTALRWAWKQGRETRWLLLWFAGGFLLLSACASKRERYLFLILPPAVIMLARYIQTASFDRLDRMALRVTAIILIAASCVIFLFGAGVTVFPHLARSYLTPSVRAFLDALHPWQLWIAAPLLGLAAVSGAWTAWRSTGNTIRPSRFVTGAFIVIAMGSLAFDIVITPPLDPLKTGARFIGQVRSYEDTGGALYLYRKDYDGRFNIALRRRHIPIVGRQPHLRGADVRAILNAEEPGAIICGWRDDPEGQLPPPFDRGHVLATGILGGRSMYLVGNEDCRHRR